MCPTFRFILAPKGYNSIQYYCFRMAIEILRESYANFAGFFNKFFDGMMVIAITTGIESIESCKYSISGFINELILVIRYS